MTIASMVVAGTAYGDDSELTGEIVGVVKFLGEVPNRRIPDNAGKRHPLLEVDRKSQGLRYAVAYFAFDGEMTPPARERENADQATEPIVIDQRDHEFTPHLIAIRSGSAVRFTNSDAANHNVHASSIQEKNQFNVLTDAGRGYRNSFVSDRNRPVQLTCGIHPWMRAWIYPFDHPYFAVTNAKGEFHIGNLPPGQYKLVVRQPDGGLSRKKDVEVAAGQTTRVSIEFTPSELGIP